MPTNDAPATTPGMAIKLSAPWERVCAGEWLPLVVDMQRNSDGTAFLQLESVTSEDPNIQLNTDLIQPRLEIRPGESYRCTIPLCVVHPQQINLASLVFTFSGSNSDAAAPRILKFKTASKLMAVKPAISQEIETTLKPICRYEEGIKVVVTFVHRGSTHFSDWSLSLGPNAAIKAGKPALQRPTFLPGDREQIELVVIGGKLEAVLSATIDGQRGEYRQDLIISAPPSPDGKRFRFLEPTRLAQDSVRIFRLSGEDKMYAEKRQEAFLLCGGERYLVEIEPRHPGVQEVKLNGLGHQIQVLKSERKGELWTFTIDVTAANIFRTSERLYYEVNADSTKLTGEIPICLNPDWMRHWRLALTACALISFQGLAGIARWIANSDYSLASALSEFRPSQHLLLLGMTFSTPFLWGLIKVADWLQYRLLR